MNGFYITLATIVIPILNDTYRLFFLLPLVKTKITFVIEPPLIIILIIVFLSQINLIMSHIIGSRGAEEITIQHIFAFNCLLPLTYIISQQIKKNDLKVICWLFAIDSVFVLLQSWYGVSTFYESVQGFEIFNQNLDLMYFARPFGLGNNASVYAEKLVIFSLIYHYLIAEFNYRFSKILLSIIVIAGIVNLGRTALATILIFLLIVFLRYLIRSLTVNRTRRTITAILVLFLLLSSITIIWSELINLAIFEFTRGTNNIDLSGRDIIWDNFLKFIVNHPWMGNGSVKYYTDYGEKMASGHNSFLMMAATHGLFITSFYVYLLFRFINKINYIYLIPIILFSLGQYSIFWGLSLPDIFLFYFLRLGNNFNYKHEVNINLDRFFKEKLDATN
jgi:hypothetical protein